MKINRILIILTLILFFTTPLILAADGSSDPFFLSGTNFDDKVRDLALQPDGKAVVVGDFSRIVGAPLNRVARIQANGNVDPTFNPGTGANGQIFAVRILIDGKILIGGSFTLFNGVQINRFARLNTDGSFDNSFAVGNGFNSDVNTIALLPNNKILVGGRFSAYNGTGRNGIALLNSDGSLDTSFIPSTALQYIGELNSLVLQPDGKILVGGNFFDNVSNSFRNLVRLNSNGSIDTSFLVKTDQAVFSIAIQNNGKILIGGQFGTVNGVGKPALARLEVNGVLDNTFAAPTALSVNKIVLQTDGKPVLAGKFVRPAGLNYTIARLNTNGSQDATFTQSELDTLNSVILMPDERIIGCGYLFQNSNAIGGANRAGVRRYNQNGTRDNSYITRHGATQTTVFDVQVQTDGKILVHGGGFTIGGLQRPSLGRLLPDGTVDEAFQPSVGGTAVTTQSDGKVVVAGVQINSDLWRVDRYNNDGSIDQIFTAQVGRNDFSNEPIVADMVTQTDGKIIMVGGFDTVNGIARKYIVRLNTDGSIDSTFNTPISFTSGFFNSVILQSDGKLYISGRYGNPAPFGMSRLNSDGSIDGSFNTQIANNRIYKIALHKDGYISICGFFT